MVPGRRNSSALLPFGQEPADLLFDLVAGAFLFDASGEKLIVSCLRMPNVGNHGQPHRLFIETFPRCGTSDPTTVFQTRMFGYGRLSTGRASRKELAHAKGKGLDIVVVQLRPPHCLALTPAGSSLLVCQTFSFGLLQRLTFHQKPLPFIALSSSAPLQDYGRQGRALPRPPSEGCVAGRKENQMIEVSAGQAQDSSAFDKGDPSALPQGLTALRARGTAAGNENLQVCAFVHASSL